MALKRWNFPDNLDFKGKIMTKFLIRSLISLSLRARLHETQSELKLA